MMKISIIIPVWNGGENFRRCLDSIQAYASHTHELIVVADGDTDGSRDLAQQVATQVVLFNQPGGPARARNAGAAVATGDVLFFIDADVTLHDDTIDRLMHVMADPAVDAVIGSYDDNPGAPQFVSQYRNLLHHYTHQTGRERAATFWGACGGIRADVFSRIGGFDEARYPAPSVEDIELGYRLRVAGCQLLLDRHLLVTHWKRWTPRSIIVTDVVRRAIPWTTLLLEHRTLDNDLNTDVSGRASVALAGIVGLGMLASVRQRWSLILSALAAICLIVINWPMYRYFSHLRGPVFAARTVPWHWIYFICSGAGFVLGSLRWLWTAHLHPDGYRAGIDQSRFVTADRRGVVLFLLFCSDICICICNSYP